MFHLTLFICLSLSLSLVKLTLYAADVLSFTSFTLEDLYLYVVIVTPSMQKPCLSIFGI